VVAVAPYFIFPGVREPGWPYLLYGLIYVPLLTRLAFIVVPVIIGFAIQRYRLWDIDLIIRRTLIYGVLSTTLAVIYAGTVITLQPLFGAVTGQQQSELSTVISTLAVAALFGPLRGWVQQLIDRRFYRQKYDAGQALAAFSSSLANEVDVQRLTERLEDVIGRTLQPAHVSLWVKASTEAEARGTGRG
jgi:type III secretory pathway component EscS